MAAVAAVTAIVVPVVSAVFVLVVGSALVWFILKRRRERADLRKPTR